MKVLDYLYFIPGVLYDSNCYLIGEDELIMVDCGTGVNINYLYSRIKSLGLNADRIVNVILSHIHFDHCGGLNRLLEEFNPDVSVFEAEAPFLERADRVMMLLDMFGASFKPVKVNTPLKDGQLIKVKPYTFRVIHTPGHTMGSICLYEEDKKLLISGDTVFAGGSFGRVDLPSGNISQLSDSVKRLSKLDVKYILPGHMDISYDGNKDISIICNMLGEVY
ncbi:MAG: MBL fold metallo-hydrolase, partial [Candidatus Odinarchaeota archaeon]